MPENDSPVIEKGEENLKETWCTESDYYDVKRFLELKESVKVRKNNPNGGNGSSKDCAGKAGREPIHHAGFGAAGKKKRRGQKGKS